MILPDAGTRAGVGTTGLTTPRLATQRSSKGAGAENAPNTSDCTLYVPGSANGASAEQPAPVTRPFHRTVTSADRPGFSTGGRTSIAAAQRSVSSTRWSPPSTATRTCFGSAGIRHPVAPPFRTSSWNANGRPAGEPSRSGRTVTEISEPEQTGASGRDVGPTASVRRAGADGSARSVRFGFTPFVPAFGSPAFGSPAVRSPAFEAAPGFFEASPGSGFVSAVAWPCSAASSAAALSSAAARPSAGDVRVCDNHSASGQHNRPISAPVNNSTPTRRRQNNALDASDPPVRDEPGEPDRPAELDERRAGGRPADFRVAGCRAPADLRK